jgi:5'-deoxynucleotidase
MEEKEAGNLEFRTAELTTRESIEKMSRELPEVRDFLIDFLPSYGNTLDELIGRQES